jgi:hypothetical protein
MAANPSASLLRTEVGFVRRLALISMVSGTAWLSQLVIALVFAIGVLPTGHGPRSERESELSIKGAEDCEVSRRNNLDAQAPRRLRPRPGEAPFWEIEAPRAPLALAPRRITVPQPSWQRPRRSIPDDDDDELLA